MEGEIPPAVAREVQLGPDWLAFSSAATHEQLGPRILEAAPRAGFVAAGVLWAISLVLHPTLGPWIEAGAIVVEGRVGDTVRLSVGGTVVRRFRPAPTATAWNHAAITWLARRMAAFLEVELDDQLDEEGWRRWESDPAYRAPSLEEQGSPEDVPTNLNHVRHQPTRRAE